MPTTPLERFQALLRELFQFEHADLDFGIYRIMNLRRGRMERWLTADLPARSSEILSGAMPTFDDDLATRLHTLREDINAMQAGAIDADGNLVNEAVRSLDKGQEYERLFAQQQRAPVQSAADLEILVYNHLYDFFSRYYDTGDFIPKRRRSFAPDGRDTYAIPWDGEEVVLHWANKDQYYIKTGERFTHYRWTCTAVERTFTIEFRLTDADLPANNNKDANKKFHLPVENGIMWNEDESTLLVPFHYRGLTPNEEREISGTQEAKIRQNVIARCVERLQAHQAITAVEHLVLAIMAPKRDAAGNEVADKDGNAIPLLAHHLNRWARKNESDFFIHRNLRSFLAGELDYFLKSVVLNLDNLLAAGELRAEANFRLLEAVKKLGAEIIDFLAQLEDFQKALFEKKKFITETHWCLTLDRIPDAIKDEAYDTILANDQQWAAWEALYEVSDLPAELNAPDVRTREFLDTFPSLMLDTSLDYDGAFVEQLIGGIDGLDEQTDGLIIHSDNLQALNLLQVRYREAVKCVYIDPPFNAPKSEIAYKNSFKHSSFLALIQGRLSRSMLLSTGDGSHVVAIDKNEGVSIQRLMMELFAGYDVVAVTVEHNRKGVQDAHFSFTNELAVFAMPPALKELHQTERPRDEWDYTNFRNWGGESLRTDAANCFYPVYVNDGEIIGFGDICDDEYHPPSANIVRHDGVMEIYPIDAQGDERKWRWERGTVEGIRHLLKLENARDGAVQVKIAKAFDQFKTVWCSPKYNAGDHGTKLVRNLGLPVGEFDYPKSIHTTRDCIFAVSGPGDITLDYFAGSGTTGHALIHLNRQDGGARKYILVEMGEYFDSVLKPRLLKVIFSEDWRDGTPVPKAELGDASNPYNGVSHCLKVLGLESYEDALDNIDFDTTDAPDGQTAIEFRRDYKLRYALDWESRSCPTNLAVEALETPFDYTLTLRRESGTVTVKPDLPETFAYLIGLHTRRRFRTQRDDHDYLIYTGTLHADATEVAILWRTCRDWTEEEYQKEKDWWRENAELLAPGAGRVYVNAACAIEGHVCLDVEFKKRMHSMAPGV